jgi:two-component system, OmpR family, KDP operon response regulator KdpE
VPTRKHCLGSFPITHPSTKLPKITMYPNGELAICTRADRTRADSPDRPVTVGDIVLDPSTRRVTKSGQEIHMTPKEFELLYTLMRYAGRPLPHQRLLTLVWGPEYGGEREYLRTYISQLRKKLEDDPAHPGYLLTDSYVGYRFRDP